tara:strand:+ start:202 stop:678 length:477 start_codon:yes stop_codon:yes gene_type:complete
VALAIFESGKPDEIGTFIGFCQNQSDIDNGSYVKEDEYITISISDDEVAKMKQDILNPQSYDSSNNISWTDQDAPLPPGTPVHIYTTDEYNQQRTSLVNTYNQFKSLTPSYYNIAAVNAAIATAEGIDTAAIGGTSKQNFFYFMYAADNDYLHPSELV